MADFSLLGACYIAVDVDCFLECISWQLGIVLRKGEVVIKRIKVSG